jgi:hypothetical protein
MGLMIVFSCMENRSDHCPAPHRKSNSVVTFAERYVAHRESNGVATFAERYVANRPA